MEKSLPLVLFPFHMFHRLLFHIFSDCTPLQEGGTHRSRTYPTTVWTRGRRRFRCSGPVAVV